MKVLVRHYHPTTGEHEDKFVTLDATFSEVDRLARAKLRLAIQWLGPGNGFYAVVEEVDGAQFEDEYLFEWHADHTTVPGWFELALSELDPEDVARWRQEREEEP